MTTATEDVTGPANPNYHVYFNDHRPRRYYSASQPELTCRPTLVPTAPGDAIGPDKLKLT
jgi:hypothetical protein